jgi:hypothetical protein
MENETAIGKKPQTFEDAVEQLEEGHRRMIEKHLSDGDPISLGQNYDILRERMLPDITKLAVTKEHHEKLLSLLPMEKHAGLRASIQGKINTPKA